MNREVELQQLAGKLLRGILAELGFATSQEIKAKLGDVEGGRKWRRGAAEFGGAR